jgi:hypothetical protein
LWRQERSMAEGTWWPGSSLAAAGTTGPAGTRRWPARGGGRVRSSWRRELHQRQQRGGRGASSQRRWGPLVRRRCGSRDAGAHDRSSSGRQQEGYTGGHMRHVEEERPMQLTVLNTFPFVFWEMSASSPNMLRWCDLGLLLSDFLAELLVFGGPCGGVCQKHDPGPWL